MGRRLTAGRRLLRLTCAIAVASVCAFPGLYSPAFASSRPAGALSAPTNPVHPPRSPLPLRSARDDQQGGGGGSYLADVAFISTTKGWVVGANGGVGALIMATTDGGNTWVRQDVPSTVGALNAVRFVSSTNGWAVGNDSAYVKGVIVSTTDGGASWTAKTASGTNGLYDVDFVDTLSGWAVGSAAGSQPTDPSNGVILHTADSGTTWTAQTVPAGIEFVNSVSFADATHGLAVARGSSGPAILVTSTGGATWTAESPPSDVQGLNGVACLRGTVQTWMKGTCRAQARLIKW